LEPVRRIWIYVLVASLGGISACASEATPTGSTPSQDPSGISDELEEIAADNSGSGLINEYAEFCDLIRSDTVAGTPEDLQVVQTYRRALSLAPPEIGNELEALLDYLEFGIEPDFGEVPAESDFDPGQDATEDPSSEPDDSVVFVTPDAEQLALSVSAFLEMYCRGVALNPLPPPTVPAAPGTD
jgi:hypothetical protein